MMQVFYNTIIRLLKLLGADQFFAWITPRLETGYARIAGAHCCVLTLHHSHSDKQL